MEEQAAFADLVVKCLLKPTKALDAKIKVNRAHGWRLTNISGKDQSAQEIKPVEFPGTAEA